MKCVGICFRGLEVDLPLESGNFSLSKLFGKVGVIEMTSARRKYVTSGPLDCHLCYIQTGAFQQTASKFRGSNDIVFISILEHAHHWGADFTEYVTSVFFRFSNFFHTVALNEKLP